MAGTQYGQFAPDSAGQRQILTAELTKETANLQQLQSTLQSVMARQGASSNEIRDARDAVTRKQADVDSVNRELSKLRTGNTSVGSTSTSTGTRTRETGIEQNLDPNLADSPFAPRNAGNTQIRTLQQANDQLAAQGKANADQLSAETQANQLAYTNQLQKADLQQQTDASTFHLAQMAGFDAQKPTAYAEALQKLDDTNQAYSAARAEFNKAQEIDFFDDPFGWINAQMHLPAMAARVNNLADASKMASSDFATRALMTQTAVQTSVANNAAITHNIAVGKAKQDLATAQSKLAELQGRQASDMGNALRSQAGAAGSMVMSDITHMQRAGLAEATNQQQQADEKLAGQVEIYNRMTGNNYTSQDVKTTPKLRERILNSAGQMQIGALEYADEARSAGESGRLAPEFQPAYNMAKNLAGQAAAIVDRNPMQFQKDKDAQGTAYTQVVGRYNKFATGEDDTHEGMMSPSLDKQNGYWKIQLPALQAQVEAAVKAGTTPPVNPKNILFARLTAGSKYPSATDPTSGNITGEYERIVLNKLIDMVATGQQQYANGKPVTPGDAAAMIADYYKSATAWQTDHYKLGMLGIPTPQSYAVRIGDEVVNAMDKVALERKIAAKAMQAVRQKELIDVMNAIPPN